jgi:hypothetical protein
MYTVKEIYDDLELCSDFILDQLLHTELEHYARRILNLRDGWARWNAKNEPKDFPSVEDEFEYPIHDYDMTPNSEELAYTEERCGEDCGGCGKCASTEAEPFDEYDYHGMNNLDEYPDKADFWDGDDSQLGD